MKYLLKLRTVAYMWTILGILWLVASIFYNGLIAPILALFSFGTSALFLQYADKQEPNKEDQTMADKETEYIERLGIFLNSRIQRAVSKRQSDCTILVSDIPSPPIIIKTSKLEYTAQIMKRAKLKTEIIVEFDQHSRRTENMIISGWIILDNEEH